MAFKGEAPKHECIIKIIGAIMEKVTFWQKVPKFTNKGGKRKTIFVLKACRAEVVGESESVCGICGDTEGKHSRGRKRPRRRHSFADPIGGLTLDVIYIDGSTGTRHNVLKGKKANHYTVKE